MNYLFVKAVLAFLVLPGLVGYVIPCLIGTRRASTTPLGWLGLGPLILGSALLFWCVRALYREGRGTLAPWNPPRHLVVSGVYGLSRNPMYVAVVLVLWGWAVWFSSRALVVYALVAMVVFHLRVVLAEEPWLARRHGERWIGYRARVPRWLGARQVVGRRGTPPR